LFGKPTQPNLVLIRWNADHELIAELLGKFFLQSQRRLVVDSI
jgi:hypothetical protein